jgi:hypothetical protein
LMLFDTSRTAVFGSGLFRIPRDRLRRVRDGFAETLMQFVHLALEFQDPVLPAHRHALPAAQLVELSADFLLRLLPFSDVPGDAEKCRDFAGLISQRAGMGFKPALPAFESYNLKFKRAGSTGEYIFSQLLESFAILIEDEWKHAVSPDLLKRIRFDHPQTGGVHFQQRTVVVQKLYTLRLGIEDGAEMGFTLGQFMVGIFQLRRLFLKLANEDFVLLFDVRSVFAHGLLNVEGEVELSFG